MRHLTFLTFTSEAEAMSSLAQYRVTDDNGNSLWNAAFIDAGFPVYSSFPTYDADGNVLSAGTLASGYFVNVLTNGRDADLEALSAWTGTAEEDASSPDGWKLIAGTRPQTPQRVFK